jgi:hypothetical protein
VRSASSTPISDRSKTSAMSLPATALTREPVAEEDAEGVRISFHRSCWVSM